MNPKPKSCAGLGINALFIPLKSQFYDENRFGRFAVDSMLEARIDSG